MPGDRESVRAALDLAARIGELMLRCGAGAPQVEGSVLAVAAAAGLRDLEAEITLQSLLLQARTKQGTVHTQLRVVRNSRPDYARLVAVHELVEAMVRGDHDVDSAVAALKALKARRRPFPLWFVRTGRAVLAAAVAGMIGASVTATVITFVVVLLVSVVQRLLLPLRLPEFYEGAVVAAFSTTAAWLAYVAGVQGWLEVGERGFAYIVAGGIVALLPGRAMASALEDVLSGYAVTGAGRMLSVTVSLLGLIIGIALAISVTLRITDAMGLGFVSPAVLELSVSNATIAAALVGAFCVGASGAITMQSPQRLVLPAGLLGLLGAGVFALGSRVWGIGPVTSTGMAAIVVGLVGRMAAQRMKAPGMVLVVPASFGLLPGLTIFRGLYELVGQPEPGSLTIQSGTTTLFTAGAILLAIATGTTLGEILGARADHGVRPGVVHRVRRVR